MRFYIFLTLCFLLLKCDISLTAEPAKIGQPLLCHGCVAVLKETHRQELAENLIEYYRKFKTAENLPLQEKFCDQVIKACEGVRRPTKDSEMKPHGFSVDDANEQLQKAAEKGFSSIQSSAGEDSHMQIDKPQHQLLTTPLPHEEL
ncbi:hypothetical protein HNY73_000707 [Argiope bruennichi]|uniref:Saposin B-type domain-containing protein n=1 Tax=Argiope bruennichi TaxID=94029 RepID=A0A8T0FZ56_ARGBR|nr:hypothetical protein HNY73_000707 [Argiope bruennichi]